MNDADLMEASRIDQAALDRLVDGELDEAARASLLRALDLEPGGWKRCATAFLEAQAWSEAVRPSEPAVAPRPATRPTLRPFMGIAAAVLVAFTGGFIARDFGGQGQALVVRSGHDQGQSQQPVPGPRPPAHAPAAADADPLGPSAVPEYVRLQMERQGYEVKGDRKVVAIGLQDGRKVAVPVDTVSYRFVGQRIH